MKKKINDNDYKNQYLKEWKETLTNLLKDESLVERILKVKENQFDLISYKKRLKIEEKIKKEREKEEEEGFDFFDDL